MGLNNQIGKLVKKYRIQKGMSQEDLAHLSGLDRTYISGIERSVRNISLASLEKVIGGLGIDMAIFFKDLGSEIKSLSQNSFR